MTEDGFSEMNYKSICCEGIPEHFLDKLIAKNHFSKFGKISRFILRPKRLSCTVEYENEADAERAVEEAGVFNGQEFAVNFAEREVGHVQNTEEWVDADVQSELEAMGGGQARALSATYASKVLSAPVKRNSPQRMTPKVHEPMPVAAPKINNALRGELESILRQPAYSAEERYRVLDARDKLIRLTSVKQTDIAKAENRKGFCPDMCPEKERLMRDFQRQVAIFETNKSSMVGSISHRLAIKEYSRSSADQEVPLSHELRPANVLKMTMLYLMSRIMDQVDTTQVNVSDWFHFVWDRTRSIRKDITQQELCSLDAVELVEQCARFHIHCAARLVAEDPSVFDKKINAENLTKCLQTLKYLYHDLRLKNIPSPREAEFRGYIVLLNLANSNFLWEVKQLPEHIQQSNEIKRAMAFYNVLQNNNYVRFFKMVREKETSYLSACILLGYFTRLRLRALEAIVKSHNWRKNSVFISLHYFTKILAFEDDQSAAQFFQFHGLICDNDRGVLLDKPQPAVDYCMERALELVESKRTVSVGECVCGHPLESPDIFENHYPHNSFDENGVLKPEAWTAVDQLRGDAALAKAREKTVQQQTAPTNKLETLFKIPQTSPHALPKQQPFQIPQQAQQVQSFKTPTTGFSLFAPSKSKESQSTTNSTSSNSIFNTLPKKSISTDDNLFSSSTTMNGNSSSSGKNIFAIIPKTTAANENKGLFPKSMDSKFFDVPRNDNVFQYFRPTVSDFGTSGSIDKSALLTKAAHEEAIRKKTLEAAAAKAAAAVAEEKKQAAAEAQRQFELEQEQKRQLEEAERQRKAMEARIAAERRRQKLAELESNAEREQDALISSTIFVEISKIVNNELHLYQSFEMRTRQLTDELLNEFISDEVRKVAMNEYNIHCHDYMLLERYFNIWLSLTRKKIAQRKLLEAIPISVTTATREEQAEQLLHPTQMFNINMMKRYRHGEPCNFRKLLWDEDLELSSRSSIDICKMISKYLALKMPITHMKQRTYFKLLFTLPGEMDEISGFESLCSKWLQHVLHFPQDNDASQSYICTLQNNVALCVRKVYGTPPMNEAGKRAHHPECDNANGIVFFMSCANLSSSRRRLHVLLQQCNNFRQLPIAFVVYGNNDYDTEELSMALDLDDLLNSNKLCAFKFYNCVGQKMEDIFRVNVEHALHFTIRRSFQYNINNNDEFKMEKFQIWLETCLGEEMWRRWQVSEMQNPAFRKVCTILEHVIGLYNATIEVLYDIVNEDIENAAEFPTELKQFVPTLDEAYNMPLGLEYFPADWKSSQRRCTFASFIKRIRLPEIEKPPPTHSPNDMKMWLLEYAGRCIPNVERSTAAAYYAIKALIEQLTTDDMQSLEIPERMNLVSFLPVLKPLIFAHINEQLQHTELPSQIIYRKEKLRFYLEQPWWLTYEAVVAVSVDYNSKSNREQQQPVKRKDPAEEVEAALKRAVEISQIFEQKKNATKIYSHNSLVDDTLLQQFDQTMHDLETTKSAGLYELPTPASKRKCSKKLKENIDLHDAKEEPISKRAQTNGCSSSNVNDVITRALSIIEKANAAKDAKLKLDYSISKLNL